MSQRRVPTEMQGRTLRDNCPSDGQGRLLRLKASGEAGVIETTAGRRSGHCRVCIQALKHVIVNYRF